jgi:hypothetical protein
VSRAGILERAGKAVAARLDPSDGRRPPFVEGLLLGAVVGAAIAGSTLWSRWRASRQLLDPDQREPRADSRQVP